MRKLFAVLAALVALTAGLTAGAGAVASPAGQSLAAKAPFDRAFIDAMVPHHRSAIEMVRVARRYGLSEPVLISVGRDIVASQNKEIGQMLTWRKRWYGSAKVDPDGAMELGLSEHAMGMDHDLGELRRAADVNKVFAQMMIPHHQGAIRMARLALKRAQHAEVKTLARAIITSQQREVRLMEPYASGKHQH